MLKAVILDFDGVILESCDIKTKAFQELFKNYPKHLDAIVDYHINHGGVSRYKKFIHFYKNILKQPINDEKIKELGEKFSRLILDEVKICPFVPGAPEFLEEYYKKLKLYIASGTPEKELCAIVKERGLEIYFKGVYGTPATKSEIIRRILKQERLRKNEVIFVGDSETDYKEALKAGVGYIARINDSINFIPEDKRCISLVEDLNGLIKFLRKA